jgi:hypothetical protein
MAASVLLIVDDSTDKSFSKVCNTTHTQVYHR